jgi:hypothetical protein
MRIVSRTAAKHASNSVLDFQLPCNPLHVATCVMRWCGTVRNTSGGRLLQIRELGGPHCRVNAHRTCWRYSTAQGAPEVARRGEPLFADLVVPFSDCSGICLLQVAFLAFPRPRDVLRENPCLLGRGTESLARRGLEKTSSPPGVFVAIHGRAGSGPKGGPPRQARRRSM